MSSKTLTESGDDNNVRQQILIKQVEAFGCGYKIARLFNMVKSREVSNHN